MSFTVLAVNRPSKINLNSFSDTLTTKEKNYLQELAIFMGICNNSLAFRLRNQSRE